MSTLPQSIPDTVRRDLANHLADHGLTLGPLRPGTRVTHTIESHGAPRWQIKYLGTCGGDPVWRIDGPGVPEQGLMVDTGEALDLISATDGVAR